MSAISSNPPTRIPLSERAPLAGAAQSADTTATTGPASRIMLSPRQGLEASDGLWWPRTRELRSEVPPLDVAIHKLTRARIARIAYERNRWSDAPNRLRTPLGMTHLGWFEHSRYPDHVVLSLSSYQQLVLVVLPPDTDGDIALSMLELAGT
ncbi:hypothetical protein GCM10009740_06140 [Terrabacter terrae]|uniref:Uncharacterized protein n=1 Tax=Terrabacter terrae TaxID=318434 RepID=A0ABN2TUE5_9MICO